MDNSDPTLSRIFSRADCETVFQRVVHLTTGGDTAVILRSTWTANLRWARNRPTTSGDTTAYSVLIAQQHRGAIFHVELNQLDDATLTQAIQTLRQQIASSNVVDPQPIDFLAPQQYLAPSLWNDATFRMTPQHLSDAARVSVDPVVDAKLVSAGYAELSAASWAIFNTHGLAAYAAATGGMYAATVRNLDGTASGWAGQTHMEWAKLDPHALSATALTTCIASAHPRAIEPGRYTAILEPDVVSRMFSFVVQAMDLDTAEREKTVFTLAPGKSKIGLPVLDRRITISTDPTDVDGGYMPFDPEGYPYRPVTWVEHGVLKALAYDRRYAKKHFGTDVSLPNPQAFRVSGGDTSIEEMIATTKRGVLVTNTSGFHQEDEQTLSLSAVTRNGLFLVENGKVKYPIKNMWIRESPMFVFNKIVQLGPPVRTYGPIRAAEWGNLRDIPARALNNGRAPVVAPPIKVEDFNFTQLSDAI